MEENLRRLSNCLSQASQVVQELAANSGRNVVADATVGETSTSTNTSITTVGQAVSRARAMMRQSTTRGLYSRLNSRERLRASSSSNSAPVKSKRAKVESNKVFEFVLLRLDDEDDEELNSDSVHSDSWMLTDESTVLRGFVTLSSEDNEEAIRKALSDAIQMKYPAVASNDLVFLKANRRRITQPVNCHEYSFKQVKSLAGQGAIYLRLKLRANESNQLSRRQLSILLLRPSFSEEGTNVRKYENDAYAAFSKYVREAASGRRGRITLGSILQFATGMDEEPPLDFELQPSIQFVAANEGIKWSFIPKANTCSKTMFLPRGSNSRSLPAEKELFEVYDIAFTNTFFGLS